MVLERVPVSLLRVFTDAVAKAAYDIELETQPSIRVDHFFDTDFLFRTVFGYRSLQVKRFVAMGQPFASYSVERPLAPIDVFEYQALLSAAINFAPFASGAIQLPRIHTLTPHAEELYDLLAQDRPDSSSALKSALSVLGVRDAFLDVAHHAKTEGDFKRVVNAFVTRLLKAGPHLLVAFDISSPQPWQRVRQLLDLGLNAATPFDFGLSVLEDPWFEEVERSIAAYRFEDGRVPVARLRPHTADVLALAMAAHGVAHPPVEEGRQCRLRFYTDTAKLRLAVGGLGGGSDTELGNTSDGGPALSSLLTYEPDEGLRRWPTSARNLLRDEYYYLLRILIPQLSFNPDVRDSGLDHDRRSADEFLDDIHRVALAAADIGDTDLYDLLSNVRGDQERSLADYLDDLGDLSFVGTVWRNWIQSDRASVWIATQAVEIGTDQLREVREFETKHDQKIKAEVERRLAQVERNTHNVAIYSDAFVTLSAAIVDRCELLQEVAEDRSMLADAFGFWRWSLGVGGEVLGEIGRLIGLMGSASTDPRSDNNARGSEAESGEGHHGDFEARCQRLARCIALRLTENAEVYGDKSALAAVGLARLLGADRIAAEGARRHQTGMAARIAKAPNEPVGDKLRRYCGFAAAIGAMEHVRAAIADLDTSAETEPHLAVATALNEAEERVTEAWEVLGSSGALPRAVALGYLRFKAWTALNPDFEMDETRPPLSASVQPDLIGGSLNVVAEAIRSGLAAYPSSEHAWLVNHLLYVSAVGDVERPHPEFSRETLAEQLVSYFGGEYRVRWSYRFADSLAYHHYLAARRAWCDAGKVVGRGTPLWEYVTARLDQAEYWA